MAPEPDPEFTYRCSGMGRCSSNEIVGWVTAGQAAQTPQADFEIEVRNPVGETTITCIRGCGLRFIRYFPNRDEARRSFSYGGSGASVHGWIIPESN
jgi:hypothetical protein